MKVNQRLIAIIITTILLTSCATKPGEKPATTSDADALYQQGDFSNASQGFLEQAESTAGTEKVLLRLRAVISLVQDEKLPQAIQLFETVVINENDPRQAELTRLTRAHIANAERDAETVLHNLSQPFQHFSESVYLSEFHQLRAQAYSMQGDRVLTAREYILQGNYIFQQESIIENQRNTWTALSMLSERALKQYQPAPAPDVLSGWMELVRISKLYQLNPVMLNAAITNWQRSYSDHPVHASLLDGLKNRKQEDVKLPKNIALLLPLTGKFANAAKAIRDGFLASYYSDKKTGADKSDINIRVYDTNGNPEAITAVYQDAIANGAEFIIGPLNKNSIEKLIQENTLSVPTLALNYTSGESEIASNLYQFGLSPEEEARQVAERTWLDGHVNAAILTPVGPWGDRVYHAFRERWEQIGGKIIEQQSYNASKNDYSLPIRQLLNIDESRVRYRVMSRLLKTKLKYTTRRRQDIDFIFIAGYPRQARQIRPQLKFFHASNVPVYATSHIFTGNLNPERDRDMDGIRFGDMPWVLTDTTSHRGLRNEIESLISTEGNKHQRLYALGVDAFNIIAALNTLKAYPYERYQGETGSLSLDAKQRVQRQLSWVYFRSGRPIILEKTSQ